MNPTIIARQPSVDAIRQLCSWLQEHSLRLPGSSVTMLPNGLQDTDQNVARILAATFGGKIAVTSSVNCPQVPRCVAVLGPEERFVVDYRAMNLDAPDRGPFIFDVENHAPDSRAGASQVSSLYTGEWATWQRQSVKAPRMTVLTPKRHVEEGCRQPVPIFYDEDDYKPVMQEHGNDLYMSSTEQGDVVLLGEVSYAVVSVSWCHCDYVPLPTRQMFEAQRENRRNGVGVASDLALAPAIEEREVIGPSL